MSDRMPAPLLLLLGFILGAFVAALILVQLLAVEAAVATEIKAEAIEHGFARYNPRSGDWEWVQPLIPEE